MKAYNVLTVFDSSADYIPLPYPNSTELRSPSRLTNNPKFIPNAPMRAKDTLLAQCLKNGLPTAFRASLGEGSKFRRSVREYRSGVKDRMNMGNTPTKIHPLHRKQLIGKILGVEIEYYPEQKVETNALTELHRDGSLDDGGEEICRLTWASKSGRLEGLLGLKIKGRVNRKCGLHVHVDARGIVPPATLTAEATYDRVVEFYPHLKKLVPRSRLSNIYCEWVNNREGAVDYICPSKGQRYAAVNWCSFKKHATIEFRCQGGTLNKLKIESWALLCQFIVQYAANPENEIPSTWREFLEILEEPLRSWCFLRKESLHGTDLVVSERALSAIE